ncbi:MAG: hypothetical protein ACP5LG_08340, partial [Conexivisphaera sp.]
MRLCETPWFREQEIYKNIYSVLSLEDRLPDPCAIEVLDPGDASPPDGVLGFATDAMAVWFRVQPPPPGLFAHEVIHLTRKSGKWHEEVYAYDLADMIVVLAEGTAGQVVHNPLRLFENVTIEDVAAAICEVTRIREICDRPPREAIAEFMGIMGVIPAFARPALEGGMIKVRVRDDYSDDDVALMTLVELVDV